MPNGSFWTGRGGFNYKRSGGGGNHRVLSLSAIANQYSNVNNKYVPGTGIGASSIASRRAKLIRSTSCASNYPCNKSFSQLGLQSRGGSNNYALNWYLTYIKPFELSVIILPTLAGNDTVATFCSGDGNTIIGYSAVNENNIAVKWVNNNIYSLNLLSGSSTSDANGCSYDGSIIVGNSDDVQTGNNIAVQWKNGVVTTLNTQPLGIPNLISLANKCSVDGTTVVGYYEYFNSGFKKFACVWVNNVIFTLPGLSNINNSSEANYCSGDGSIIVGYSIDDDGIQMSVKWTKTGYGTYSVSKLESFQGTIGSTATACSVDGNIIVGYYSKDAVNGTTSAIQWTNGKLIELINNSTFSSSIAFGCSYDGSIVVGGFADLKKNLSQPVKWNNNSPSILNTPPGYSPLLATTCSYNGNVIVGTCRDQKTGNTVAIKWYY
jgi:uncharacterized membrane protein